MVGAVEKAMNGVSDGMAKEWRAGKKEDKENEENVYNYKITAFLFQV